MTTHACAKCSGIKTFAVLVTGTELLLLIVTFFTTAYSTDAFISTELQNNFPVRVLLSMFVIASTLVCLAYIYIRTGPSAGFGWALLGALVSVAGWATLVATEMETAGHITGTSLFVAGTGVYVLVMFMLTNQIQCTYVAGYALVAVFALLFIILDYTDCKAGAALCEWAALATNTLTLLLFFATHSFDPQKRPLVELSPLLGGGSP